MPSRPRTQQSGNSSPRAAASRAWRASLIRKRAQVLGDVQAPSREAAEAAGHGSTFTVRLPRIVEASKAVQ
jgi:hypothetical protein